MQILRIVCIALHLFVVIFTSVIYGVWSHALETQISPDADLINRIMHYVQIGLQVITVVYGAAMVLTTQQLAMRIQLSRYQYLTTTHDISLAWAGLGAALMSLWRQWKLQVSAVQVLGVAIYLTSVALLHVTIPTLFSITLLTDSLGMSSSLALPNVTVPMTDLIEPLGSLSGLSGPGGLDFSRTAGLYGNVIYDTITSEISKGSSGLATVNATVFDVTCGYLPNSTFNAGISINPNGTGSADVFGSVNETWSFNWVPFTLPSIQLPDVGPVPFSNATSADFLLYSTVLFRDSFDGAGSVFTSTYTSAAGTQDTIQLQLMGCIVGVFPGIGTLDVISRTLTATMYALDTDEPQPLYKRKGVSEWLPFYTNGTASSGSSGPWPQATPPVPSTPWSSIWRNLLNQNRSARSLVFGDNRGVGKCDTTFSTNCLFTSDEMFIMNDLSFTTGGSIPERNLKLHVLENSLANMTAAIVWSAVQNNYRSGRWGSGADFTGRVDVQSSTSKSGMLQLNKLQVMSSFVASLIAFFFCLVLTWGKTDDVDTAGILQVMYMSRARYADVEPFDITQAVTVEKGCAAPSDLALRRAGLVKMRLYARRPVKLRSDYEENWRETEWDSDDETLKGSLMRPLPPLPSPPLPSLPLHEAELPHPPP